VARRRQWVAVAAASSRSTSGSTNAAVLPVPVSAQATMSPPARTSGSTADWIGVVWAKPRSRMPEISSSWKPSVSKASGSVSGTVNSLAGSTEGAEIVEEAADSEARGARERRRGGRRRVWVAGVVKRTSFWRGLRRSSRKSPSGLV
jgi:hypothetical protein